MSIQASQVINGAVIAVLIVLVVMQFNTIQDCKQYLQSRNTEIQELYRNISSLLHENNKLSLEYAALNESYHKLDVSHVVLQQEVDKTINKINDYETQLQNSMAWFSNNAYLNIEDPYERRDVEGYLDSYCVRKTEDKCRIKLGCFHLINSNKMGYMYKYDIQTSNAFDKLQSVNEFVENAGGDCEDYSLFYKAEYNYLLDGECKGVAPENIVLDTWHIDEDSYASRYYLEFTDYWYLEDVSRAELPRGYIYPNVVCGHVYDFNMGRASGHCIVAFTKEKIESKGSLAALNKAPMIEPQNGRYMGLINDPSSGISILEEHKTQGYYPSYIYEVLTDSDFFIFSLNHSEWLSYSILDTQLSQQKQELLGVK